MDLNPFLIECHEKLKSFFRSCCEVEELETYFNISEFTEAVLISPPSVIITVEVHELVLYQKLTSCGSCLAVFVENKSIFDINFIVLATLVCCDH